MREPRDLFATSVSDEPFCGTMKFDNTTKKNKKTKTKEKTKTENEKSVIGFKKLGTLYDTILCKKSKLSVWM